VLDIRTLGLVAAIDLASKPDAVGKRAYEARESAFHAHDIVPAHHRETLALTPPLTISEAQIGEVVDKLRAVIQKRA